MESKGFGKQDSYLFRFIAIMMVIAAHYSNYLYALTENRIWNLMNKLGRYGVALFFLVSGYGLIYSIKGKDLDYHFLLRRMKCLYLPFIIMQLLALTYIGIPNNQMSVKDWIYYFIGVSYWYVPVIFFLYCTFYIAMKYFKKYREPVLFLLVTLLNIVLALMGCAEWWYLTNYVFCLGVFLAIHEKNQKINFLHITVLFFIGFVISSILYSKITATLPHDLFKIMAAICFAGCIWFLYALIPFRIHLKPISYIGKCSFYIYIFHVQALNLLQKYTIDSYVVIILSIFIVILISILFDKIITRIIKI